jgi:hypothetical protein
VRLAHSLGGPGVIQVSMMLMKDVNDGLMALMVVPGVDGKRQQMC